MFVPKRETDLQFQGPIPLLVCSVFYLPAFGVRVNTAECIATVVSPPVTIGPPFVCVSQFLHSAEHEFRWPKYVSQTGWSGLGSGPPRKSRPVWAESQTPGFKVRLINYMRAIPMFNTFVPSR